MNITFPDPAVSNTYTDPNTGINWIHDGSMWVIATAGGTGGSTLPTGGNRYDVLRKKSTTNGDAEWSNTLDAGGW